MKVVIPCLLLAVSSIEIGIASIPKVPAVQYAGLDGIPKLPSIGNVLDDYSKTAQGTSSKIGSLADLLRKSENDAKAKLVKMKAEYDKKLAVQEAENRKIQKSNSVIAQKIMAVHKSTDAMEATVKKQQKVTTFRKTQLKLLGKEFDRAHKAADDLVAAAEAMENPEPPAPPAVDAAPSPAAEQAPVESLLFDADADAKDAKPHISFLELDSTVRGEQENVQTDSSNTELQLLFDDAGSKDSENDSLMQAADAESESEETTALATEKDQQNSGEEQDLMDVLKQGLSGMRNEQHKSQKHLQEMFLKAYKAGEARHKALLEQQEALNKKLEELQEKATKLRVQLGAQTKEQKLFQERTASMGGFLERLSKAASAPLDKVKPALQDAKMWKEDPME
eukprot:TRINITY_DN7943_c0_g1_i2.p1 TRINITY_DN7943_c0_g1~~TRINITY_DN7943_c0_g1_i2.p1  ORF type:complete len:394 (+),score=152.56 TRINITY_DN7943_c0_g1_i2:72-1253(+)